VVSTDNNHSGPFAVALDLPSPGLPKEARVVVAMSGGVDSSVVAWMLAQSGHASVGLFMRNGVEVDAAEVAKKSCCSVGDARDARMISARLELPFQAVDLAPEFSTIIDYFVSEYRRGRTPNPCAVCNRDLKFDALLRFAQEFGAEYVATGHYARLERPDNSVDGRVWVRRGVDPRKDQSYQLFCVREENLARTVLPLGGLHKPEVRQLAERMGLRTAKKPDSQEICFVPSNDYRRLLKERGVRLTPGKLVDTTGRVLGDHPGIEHFTIGQRRGLGVAAGVPMFVVDIVPSTATVVVGIREECSSSALITEELNLIGFDPPENGAFRADVQVRYHHDAAPASVEMDRESGTARIVFDDPQHAVAPGQGAALYQGDRMIGGGWIASTEPLAMHHEA
jgi:tRNA-specific 2-thiouridylase